MKPTCQLQELPESQTWRDSSSVHIVLHLPLDGRASSKWAHVNTISHMLVRKNMQQSEIPSFLFAVSCFFQLLQHLIWNHLQLSTIPPSSNCIKPLTTISISNTTYILLKFGFGKNFVEQKSYTELWKIKKPVIFSPMYVLVVKYKCFILREHSDWKANNSILHEIPFD